MRPVRFVALSEDGTALILTDEVGRMLSLTIEEPVVNAIRREQGIAGQLPIDVDASLTPRDIQARIRAGDSVTEVARIANVPVEKVLRFAGPVLQERAAMSQFARRTRLKSSDNNSTLGEVADARLRDHGVDPESVAWDAYRRENGTWRIAASWQSGKATARALWDLDKGRSVVSAIDDMAQFLSADRQALLAQDPAPETKPKLAAAQVFADDDDSDHRDGPVVPALSMLRRERDKRTSTAPQRREEPSQHSESEDPDVAPMTVTEAMRPTRPKPEGATPTHSDDEEASTRAPLPSWDDILFGSRP